ncbi:MAG: site-specific DNA-methyltransferase [Candidatus Magnetomorum sp.]|nr:site-specific DNA-methyltransferase [Candidatus Magnetomorum sp.]
MKSKHKIIFSDSRKLTDVKKHSVDLVVTSPPYPMIEMWDDLFTQLNPDIGAELSMNNGKAAFELMHKELDKVWKELDRVVKPSGFVCINIGDATRTIGKQFQLYSNHSRITTQLSSLSFRPMPLILWRKATNAPNKFMGSGMLPAGAYVTLEHEYILIFRKGDKREFSTPTDKETRNKSALFWEERNIWFSDTWNLAGVRQSMSNKKLRDRNAAYPFDLPYRLINMYAVKGDTVLDPFIGTGTTLFAAIASGRNSIGIEYDKNFSDLIEEGLISVKALSNETVRKRIKDHSEFVETYRQKKGDLKYLNESHNFPVVTRQEKLLQLDIVKDIDFKNLSNISVEYNQLSRDQIERNNQWTQTSNKQQKTLYTQGKLLP